MDILGKYEQEHPSVAPRPMASQSLRPTEQYGFFIKLVMRLSGGKIQNARQVGFVLLIAAAVILLTSLFIFTYTMGWFSSSPRNLNIPIAGPQNSQVPNQLQP